MRIAIEAMDNAVDDVTRMKTERDEAQKQLAVLQQTNEELERRVSELVSLYVDTSEAVDNAVDDVTRMKAERDEAQKQLAVLQQTNKELERCVTALQARLEMAGLSFSETHWGYTQEGNDAGESRTVAL